MQAFQDDFRTLAQFGLQADGGVSRLAFSKADQQARSWLIQRMQQLGLQVQLDAAGNLRGRLAGDQPHLSAIATGSHLDSVPNGGHYDGVIGVLAGLEVVRRLRRNGQRLARSVEVINFAAEESSRFGIATLGSKAITGKLTASELEQIHDEQGNSYASLLRQAGGQPEQLQHQRLDRRQLAAFIELHIEQGPVLEQQGCALGLVSAIAAASRFRVRLTGRNDHSGTTPMPLRRDALAAAAEMVLAVEQLARDIQAETVATVGRLSCSPGVMNVVPGSADFCIDLRDSDACRKERLTGQLQSQLQAIARRREIALHIDLLSNEQPVVLDAQLRQRIAAIARRHGQETLSLVSGAGHDAMQLADVVPTALLFVPSCHGISHNSAEQTALADIAQGVDLLYASVVELAQDTSTI
ncbi:MAG: Zn-dependent hydrolase [Desulfuromonas thiophila]|nr:Zn-dependent hydrolase [Desulfuromonas thiophila]